MTIDAAKNRLVLRAKKAAEKGLKAKVLRVKKKIKQAAIRWKEVSRRFLSKPQKSSHNTSLYPRKRTGQLRDSIYYKIRTHIGKTTASIHITYGFHEVYSSHSKKYPRFAYGSYLNEQPATYGHYRERLEQKLVSKIETIVRHTTK